MSEPEHTMIGRAQMALVFGNDDDAVAVVSTLVARTITGSANDRLVFTGPVQFDKATGEHIAKVVLPVVDRILRPLGMPDQTFELSVVNLDATAVTNIGLTISGFSADVPVLLALTSTALHMPVRQDVVATGHIASVDGDIRSVQNIPAKLDAAMAAPSIGWFVYPSGGEDGSLSTFLPNHRDCIVKAIINAKGRIRTTDVAEVNALLRAVFADDAIVLASLRKGFYESHCCSQKSNNPIDRAVQFLMQDNDRRFWAAMEKHLFAGHCAETRDILLAKAQYHWGREFYPSGFGLHLLQLVRSLPPAIQRLKTTFPLLPMDRCIELGRFAAPADHEDVRYLIEAVSGNSAAMYRSGPRLEGERESLSMNACASLDIVLEYISGESLTERIGLPIDSARAAYVMDTVTADSNQVFIDIVSAFYLQLLRHTAPPAPANSDAVAGEALGLLERAFVNKGGVDAARAEGRSPTQGGMRFVLNVMTEQFKMEKQGNYVTRVLQEAVDPLNWEERVAFMAALLDRIGPQLPSELRDRPPEVYARQHDMIVQAYVKSLDQVKAIFRTL